MSQNMPESGPAQPVISGNSKNIKVSAEGVAKLTFNFLDELQGDNSLEPGEVKTPPHPISSPSVALLREVISPKTKVPPHVVPKEVLVAKVVAKSVSQLDAEACQEKVRAILELDAIKRKEDAEKRKEQMELRQSGELELDGESKKKAKEERKRLKRLKKEQKAARLALLSDDEEGMILDDDDVEEEQKQKEDKSKSAKRSKEPTDSYESERLYSSTHSSPERSDELRASLNSVAVSPAARYQMSLPPGPQHLPPFPPDSFFRAMNPFMRGHRPDYHHTRGGFIPRGRGGLRGTMRFPGFRPPFYSAGGPQLRHHGLPMPRHHTPPPARGHSPIKPPSGANLLWTRSAPSISYAFSPQHDYSNKSEHEDTSPQKSKQKSSKVKRKLSRSTSKQRKKAKKLSSEREKAKKRRSIRSISEMSSKRKIEKIRKSLEKPRIRKRTVTPDMDEVAAIKETPPPLPSKKPKLDEDSNLGSEEAMWDVLENIKIEKVDSADLVKEITPPFELTKDTIKIEPNDIVENGNDVDNALKPATEVDREAENAVEKSSDLGFDMFAESPPRPRKPTTQAVEELLQAARKASENNDAKPFSEKVHSTERKPKESNDPPAKVIPPHESRSITPPLPGLDKLVGKTPLQKAIEIQKRIDKLLQEDDLNLETIQESKAKLMLKTKKHARETQQTQRANKARQEEKRRSLTPEVVPKHKNPFKRSMSRDRYFGKIDAVRRSRSRSPKPNRKFSVDRGRSERERQRALSRGQLSGGSSGSLNRSRSGEGGERPDSLNHSRSTDRDRDRERSERGGSRRREARGKLSKSPRGRSSARSKDNSLERRLPKCVDKSRSLERKFSKSPRRVGRHTLSKDKSQSLERKTPKSMTPPPKPQNALSFSEAPSKVETSKKSLATKKRKSVSQPLSFTAAEFLFPEDAGDGDFQITPDASPIVDEDDTVSSSRQAKSSRNKDSRDGDKDDSPDTDDYMDNWENDDPDMDINSSSTPLRSSQEDVDDKFVTRFVNPSPPMELLNLKKNQLQAEEESNTPTNSPPPKIELKNNHNETDSVAAATKPKLSRNVFNKELFGMQEIYDQFMKSVGESGVDIATPPPQPVPTLLNDLSNEADTTLDRSAENLSTSSTSTSSSSSSSSSDASNSSSSSSSSSSASSSEESNDADSFQKPFKEDSPQPKQQQQQETIAAVTKCEVNEMILPTNIVIKAEPTQDSTKSPVTATELQLTAAPPTAMNLPISASLPPPPPLPPSEPVPATAPPVQPVKVQKSNVAKDFKKLKSLEANLARIQMMRANYDSADEISEELLKMEKLFLQEKNLILQKYAKSAGQKSTTAVTPEQSIPVAAAVQSPQMANSLQQPQPPQQIEPTTVANKIFDANREAIKLTISPLKLPKTPAIFEKAIAEDNEADHVRSREPYETDFTEKLGKPAKEIAIVKPMMESKDSRSSHQRNRHLAPQSRGPHERPRSPSGGYREHSKRSTSRSRLSPTARRGRVRSLSVSPPRRGAGAGGRYVSPHRRGGNATHSNRFRNSARRSRSRSRSITRQSTGRRGGELTPPPRRRQRPAALPPAGQSHYRKLPQQRSMRDSRSRSPPPHHRSPRPHSPRSPPPPHSSQRRRSYSRERYSRSPLPFKPPSPPMRRSMSPLLASRRRPSSMSPSRSSSRRSRSLSRSRSPRMLRSPRSPRSPPPSSRYDDHRRRRGNSYDRRSMSPQRQYYDQDSSTGDGVGLSASSASSYYYNVSPNRISLDARINIVLNTPTSNQDGGANANITSYDNYSNYSQYGGAAAYMPVPPQPAAGVGSSYYAHQYMPMSTSNGSSQAVAHGHQQIYSNIPTISGSGGSGHTPHHPAAPSGNFYYNEFGGHPIVAAQHQSSSLLKELPKAGPVAVQKGNVLEIVPSNDMPGTTAAASKVSDQVASKPAKAKKVTVSWKEEVNSRHVTAAVMRLSRENDGMSRSILKRAEAVPEIAKDEKLPKKKVYFEDGIFPNRESDDEDRKEIETKIRRKLGRLRKRHGSNINIAAGHLANATNKKRREESKIDPELAKLPPPPPPLGMPPPNMEEPICIRPPTPIQPFYFHFDAVVHSMYVSQLERPIPPRLLNPKSIPPAGSGGGNSIGSVASHNPANMQSPSHMQSPSGAGGGGSSSMSHLHSSKKDNLTALAAINRSGRGSERGSPKLVTQQPSRRESPASHHMKAQPGPIENMKHTELTPPPMIINKGSFQAIGGGAPLSPQITAHPPPQRQAAAPPIGFVGMRFNNFMRLPPSPLARGAPVIGGGNPMMGMRQTYNMPPPSMMPHTSGPPPPTGQNVEFGQYPSHLTMYGPPPPHHFNGPPQQQQQQQHAHPHPHPHPLQQAPPPNYFMQTAPPLHPPMETAAGAIVGQDGHIMQQQPSPQAMVAPFNVQRP